LLALFGLTAHVGGPYPATFNLRAALNCSTYWAIAVEAWLREQARRYLAQLDAA